MKILLVERDRELALSLERRLKQEGFSVATASESQEVHEELGNGRPVATLFDLDGEASERLSVLTVIRSKYPKLPVILLANGEPDEVIERARAAGARGCIHKPFSLDEVVSALHSLLGLGGNGQPSDPLSCVMIWPREGSEASAAIRTAAESDITVLLSGETGTGKGITAKVIHALSKRRKGPFRDVSCAGLTSTLLESELFGHVKGAFTGAHTNRVGRFEAANGGTLLLDDIADLDASLQAKLLRVLQDRTFERVGCNVTRKVDVRVIATTNRDLSEEVRLGRFRADLYYRLNVLPIDLPPLRERREQIPEFLKLFLTESGKTLTPEAHSALVAHSWPGNVRELENLMVRFTKCVKGKTIRPRDLPALFSASPEGSAVEKEDLTLPLDKALEDFEARYLNKALDMTGGNKAQAAKLLGMKRTTFINRLGKHRT